jgi:hypothetical protein
MVGPTFSIDAKAVQIVVKLAHSGGLSVITLLLFRLLTVLHSLPGGRRIDLPTLTGNSSIPLHRRLAGAGIAGLLHTHLDAILSDNDMYTRRTSKLFKDLGLRDKQYRSRAYRRVLLERAFDDLKAVPLTSGSFMSATLEPTGRQKDYVLTVVKHASRPETLASNEPEFRVHSIEPSSHHDPVSSFMLVLEKVSAAMMFVVYLMIKLYTNIRLWTS